MTKCIATTATGRKCKANAMAGSQYCRSHMGGKVAKPKPRLIGAPKRRRRRALYTPRRYRKVYRTRSRSRSRTTKSRVRNLFVDKSSCRPKSKLGRALRKLSDGRVIPTEYEYVSKFPENERAQKRAEYEQMDGCELVKIAVPKKRV